MKTYIFSLVDCKNNYKTFWIGKTSMPKERLSAYCREHNLNESDIDLKILEVCEHSVALKLKWKWIGIYRRDGLL
jgi:hypothetical protein